MIEYPGLLKNHRLFLSQIKKEYGSVYTFFFEGNIHYYKAGQHFVFFLNHKNPDSRGYFSVFSASSALFKEYFSFTIRYLGEKSSSFKKAFFTMLVEKNIVYLSKK